MAGKLIVLATSLGVASALGVASGAAATPVSLASSIVATEVAGLRVGGTPAGGAAIAAVGAFDITLNFLTTMTTAQTAAFTAAEAFWESAITSYFDVAPAGTTLSINASIAPIDGPGTILGQAVPTVITNFTGGAFTYATQGQMLFDVADTPALEASGQFGTVILHEMAHVIGFGTLWNNTASPGFIRQNVYTNGTGQFTGANALAQYQADLNPAAGFVPVELGGGPGTRDGHWDETGFTGNFNDLMTGFLNAGDNPISATTIASFADIGYTVDLTRQTAVPAVAVPAPMAFWLLASGIAALGAVRRRA